MFKRRIIVAASLLLTLVVIAVLTTGGPPAPSPTAPGTFSFAAFGDAPYYPWEDVQYRLLLRDLDAHDLTFAVAIGDIFWRPCTDANYQRSRAWFNGLRHPVIYTPGDNEWADCWEPGSGAFDPHGRLRRLRKTFFEPPERSLGGRPIARASQAAREPFREFVENARWTHASVVFATVHIIGSANGMRAFPTRTVADDEAVSLRTAAAAAWVSETFAEAARNEARAVVVFFHGDPEFDQPVDHEHRAAYEPFLSALEDEVARFSRPVLAVHGDQHEYLVDHPLSSRTTGRPIETFTRLEVPGSPAVGWVLVGVTHTGAAEFTFERRVVPRWKYW